MKKRTQLARIAARNLETALRMDAPAPAYRIDPATGQRVPISPAEQLRADRCQFVTIPKSLPGTGRIKKPKGA